MNESTEKDTGKQAKETDKIKTLLKAYGTLLDRIDKAEGRLAYLEYTMDSPSSPSLSGMPSGSRDRSSKQERDYIKKEELQEKIDRLYVEEGNRREEIEGLIARMEKPNEQTVIEMRYFDLASWREISATLYEDAPDYDENEQRYLKRALKIHGSALQTLARIYNDTQGDTP